MSSVPWSALRRSEPPKKNPRRFFHWGLVIVLVFSIIALFVSSGTAWIWFRPVVHKDLINKYSSMYRFDPLWVMAIIKVESGFQTKAESHRGAIGLMQLLPTTARELAPEVGLINFQDEDLRDPDVNVRVGVYYLSKLERMFPEDEISVLAAWNAGPGVTMQWRQGKPALDLQDIPYSETRNFVRRVDRTFGYLKIIQGWRHLFGLHHRHREN